MSTLKIRIDKYLDLDDGQAPRVPARIVPVSASGKSQASTIKAFVPISKNSDIVAAVQVPEGNYYVETVLPTGEILADTVQVPPAGETLVLQAVPSPNEWFSWQQLSGNLKAPPPHPQGSKVSAGAFKTRSAAKGAPPTNVSANAPVPLPIGRPIQILPRPLAPLVSGAPTGADVWKWLADAENSDAAQLIRQINSDSAPFELEAYDKRDGERAVYRVTLEPATGGTARPLRPGIPNAPRYFAVVPRRSRVELISLPMPWRNVKTFREAAIEVATQQVHAPNEFCASVLPRDEHLGMLLGFLSSGLIPTAREIAETAVDMLYGKFENPYAAAAGGYALVGTARETAKQVWHDWIRNLMRSFDHIPDGAIQWAQLRLRIRKTQDDIEEARHALKMAYSRGLPFYSMGVRWLMEGLEWISGNDPEAASMLKNVRRVSWLTNFQQPFTIVRIGGKPHV